MLAISENETALVARIASKSSGFSLLVDTAFNTYPGREGILLGHYAKNAFVQKRIEQDVITGDESFFTYHERFDTQDGQIYKAAGLSGATVSGLHARTYLGETYDGCPMAVRSARIPVKNFIGNRHFENLVEKGVVEVTSRNDEQVHIRLEETMIDRTLILFARQLREYEGRHGSPFVRTLSDGDHKVEHRFQAPTDALQYPQTPRRCPISLQRIVTAGASCVL